MYKIGDFSKQTGASVKTLRYYDEIGLLIPSKVDSYTSYRYYTDKELNEYKRIEYLKKLGFTLEEIKNSFDNLSFDILEVKKQELIKKREQITFQINEINSLLEKSITKEKTKIILKN